MPLDNYSGNDITAAAIRVGNVIYTGYRHGKILRDICDQAAATDTMPRITQPMQGFIDALGHFLNREEAARVAYLAGQIKKPKTCLLSEDIWPEM